MIASKGITIVQKSKYALIAYISQFTMSKKLDANSFNSSKVSASLCKSFKISPSLTYSLIKTKRTTTHLTGPAIKVKPSLV